MRYVWFSRLIFKHDLVGFHSPPTKNESTLTGKYEALVGQERTAFEAAKRELEHYKTKTEGLSHDVIHSCSLSSLILIFSYVKQQLN